MTTDFGVDLAELDELVAGLRSGADDLATALGSLGSLGTVDAGKLGADSIDQACEHFRSKWQHGLGRLQECVKALDGGLATVRQNYHQTETDLAASINKNSENSENGENSDSSRHSSTSSSEHSKEPRP